jgi:hypothetical protein
MNAAPKLAGLDRELVAAPFIDGDRLRQIAVRWIAHIVEVKADALHGVLADDQRPQDRSSCERRSGLCLRQQLRHHVPEDRRDLAWPVYGLEVQRYRPLAYSYFPVNFAARRSMNDIKPSRASSLFISART